MVKEEIKIINPQGLHARPAKLLCDIATKSKSSVMITKDGFKVNGKSIMNVLMLAAEFGSSLAFEIDGHDETETWLKFKELIENKFNE
jgi:phosphocarrier protein HPr